MNHQLPDSELVDKIANKVVDVFGENPPVRRLRKSQVLSAFIGAVGFALFVDGVIKLVVDIPGWLAIAIGLALMALTGLLLHNLNR